MTIWTHEVCFLIVSHETALSPKVTPIYAEFVFKSTWFLHCQIFINSFSFHQVLEESRRRLSQAITMRDIEIKWGLILFLISHCDIGATILSPVYSPCLHTFNYCVLCKLGGSESFQFLDLGMIRLFPKGLFVVTGY